MRQVRARPYGRAVIFGDNVIFRFFIAGRIQDFARGLADCIERSYPAPIANSPEPLVSPRRHSEILEDVLAPARQFSLENRLGFLGRIKLQSALRWQLREKGYDDKFVNMAAKYLIASVTGEPK